MKKLFLLTPLLAVLAACGSGGSDSSAQSATTTQATPSTDAFTSNVSSIVEASSDTAEPVAIDDAPGSTPEDTEPSPVS